MKTKARFSGFNPLPRRILSIIIALISMLFAGHIRLLAQTDPDAISFPTNSFAPRVDFAASQPWVLAIGDLDGDGKPEIVSPTLGGTTIQVFRNTTINRSPDMTFAPPLSFESAVNPTQVQIADLDGDGRPDIAVAVSGTNSRTFVIPPYQGVSVFRNTTIAPGAITFAPRVDFLRAGSLFQNNNSLVLADFNEDAKLDMACSSGVRIFQNMTTPGVITSSSFSSNAIGTIFPPAASPFLAPLFSFVTSGDLNNDGAPDLIFGQNGFHVVLNSRGSTPSGFASRSMLFSAISTSAPVREISTVGRIGDLDGDGLMDVVVDESVRRRISIRRNVSQGFTNLALSDPILIPILEELDEVPFAFAPSDVELADLDADGRLDLVIVNKRNNTVSLIKNVSIAGSLTTNSFTPKLDLQTAAFPARVAVADLNGDSKPDIVIANANSISIFRNQINSPPVADASATSTPVISPNNLTASVVLDGSRSSDAEDDPLQFTWFLSETIPLASGEITSAILPVGMNFINLVVNDGQFSATNSVTVEVITAAQAIEKLAMTINAILPRANPLLASLNSAATASSQNRFNTTVNQLQAFQNKTLVQIGRTNPVLADSFINAAQEIIDALQSPH